MLSRLGLILAAAVLGGAGPACTLDRATGTRIDAAPFITGGYGINWNFRTNRLAYMAPDQQGFYRVFTMRPDRGDVRELTGGWPGHQGMPIWHPSGRTIMFVAQQPDWRGIAMFGVPAYGGLPGYGVHDDLWVMTADGKSEWKLTDYPNARYEGVLMPVFSPNGQMVAWASRQPGGTYVLEVADFVTAPEPHLAHIRPYQPGGNVYYEPGSFTSDHASLMYTSDQDTHSFWHSQIYRLNLATGQSERLTQGDAYSEHPVAVPTPSGDWVVYMSDKDVDRYPLHLLLGTDWWAMRPDGSGNKRLTRMNINRRNNPENAGYMQVAGRMQISPAGDWMLGDVQTSLVKQTGLVRTVHFTCE